MTLWKGRFDRRPHEKLVAFTESISLDRRLYPYDIRQSQIHARMLARQQIIAEPDAETIIAELDNIKSRLDRDEVELSEDLEDIHMNIEQQLIESLGDVGARLHTGRSRNDQIATDERMYLRDRIDTLQVSIADLQRVLVEFAENHPHALLPGMTHLQHAQPVRFPHHLLAYVEMFERDKGRLQDARKRVNLLPLGAGALAGSTLPLDREYVAAELGFDGVLTNSMDAVADRDYVVEVVAALSAAAMHVSRMAEDIILWCSDEFGFLELDDAFCTGSSLMPQKKNPDIAELARAKTGRIYGDLINILTVLKSLPLTYNRDLQEDKHPMFDAVDTMSAILDVFPPMLASARLNESVTNRSASETQLMATDLAEWLVQRGVPFRQAHEQIGRYVAFCRDNNLNLDQATIEQMKQHIPDADASIYELFTPQKSADARNTMGGTGSTQIRRRLDEWKTYLRTPVQ